jgi:hypothetical protein
MSGRKKQETPPDSIELKRSQPSVELKRDAKGNMTIVVKSYADDVSQAADFAVDVYDKLCEQYGLGD